VDYDAHYHGSGFAAGVAVGAAATRRRTTGVVYTQPTTVVVTAAPPPPIGTTVTVLPSGYAIVYVHGTQYYKCGSSWYQFRLTNAGTASFVVVRPPQ
jgi:hypothetical protein